MSCNGNHRNGSQSGSLLNLCAQLSYNCSRLGHDSELLARNVQGFKNGKIKISGHGVEHL